MSSESGSGPHAASNVDLVLFLQHISDEGGGGGVGSDL